MSEPAVPAADTASPDDPPSFEAAMDRLEDSVLRLESGELTLEESLEVFERGIAASRACARLLDETRKRVQVLVKGAGGELRLEFLDSSDGSSDGTDDGTDEEGYLDGDK